MNRRTRFLTGLLLLLTLVLWAPPTALHGQDDNLQEACHDRIVTELSTVHDEYRSVLFGSRQDEEGKWIANTGGEVSEERKGIFEIQGRETHELIWPLVESYRVYRCKSMSVCEAMGASFDAEDDSSFDVHLLGCGQETFEPFEECSYAQEGGTIPDANVLTTDCRQLVEDTLEMEQAVLRLAVAYDSGYRGALQFIGMADWMMKDYPKRAFVPLRGMVNMFGRLHQIPCFMGQCDMPDNSDIQLPE